MALAKPLVDEGRPYPINVSAIFPWAVADELVDASPADIECSEKIDPFDVLERPSICQHWASTPRCIT